MRTIIISDTHLGIDDRFSECVQNKKRLIGFLEQVRESGDVDELVIAGDFLDGWFLPGAFIPGESWSDFYGKVAANCADVIRAFQSVIDAGVKVVYIPGNHDMTLEEDVIAVIFPGMEQARDTNGLGAYRTGARNEVRIEHGHRFNLFCAPDPLSNGGTSILPPGYFFTRIAVTWVLEGRPDAVRTWPEVPQPEADDTDQIAAYAYYQTWRRTLNTFPVDEDLDSKFIHVGIDGLAPTYAIDDILPKVDAAGRINAQLYAEIQARWDELQEANGVAVHIPFVEAANTAELNTSTDQQAWDQYLDRDNGLDVVVFGHTHVPLMETRRREDGVSKVYANSGTWIDRNTDSPTNETCTYVRVDSTLQSTHVQLFMFNEDGTSTLMEESDARKTAE